MMSLDVSDQSKVTGLPPKAVRAARWPLVVAAALALVLVAFANIVGHRFPGATATWHCRHGWPWEYLARWRADPVFVAGAPRRISLWPTTGDATEFRPLALAGNVVVGLLAVAATVVATLLVRRAWPRIRPHYRSTWVVVGLGLSVCGFANYAGQRLALFWPYACGHGWPWPWLYREATAPTNAFTVSIWTPYRDVLEFRPNGFLMSLAACLSIVTAIAAVWEWRRRGLPSAWQFTLKDALVATSLLAVPLAWLSMSERWPPDETSAVTQLRAAGHGVYVAPRRPDWFWDLRGIEPEQTIGTDCLNPAVFETGHRIRLTSVDAALLREFDLAILSIDDSPIDDGSLRFLGRITHLRQADFNYSGVTDEGLATLRAARGLRRLEVAGCLTSDSGLRHVAEMTELRELLLWETAITDDGLAHVRSLPELQRLNIGMTEVTDAGMAHVAALKNLESVSLHHTAIGDEGVSWLAALPKLRGLRLSETRITDVSLRHLLRTKHLANLDLSDTAITDAGLENVAQMDQLEFVSLRHCPGCTEEGVRRLREAKPSLSISGVPDKW